MVTKISAVFSVGFKAKPTKKTFDVTSKWSGLGGLREERRQKVEGTGVMCPSSRMMQGEEGSVLNNSVTYLRVGHHICKSDFLEH